MHSQLNFKMRFNRKKIIVVTPGINGGTISSCQRPLLFGSRALCEIGLLQHIARAFARHEKDSKVKVLLLRRYVLSVLSQLATGAYSRGLIQRELQLAIVYIIGLLDVVFKIMSDKPV